MLCALLLLTACPAAQDSADTALDDVGEGTSNSYNKIREVTGLSHKQEPKPTPQPRYCYKTFEDVVCYGAPVAGQDIRLVGYQDATGKTGYVLPDNQNSASVAALPPLKPVAVPMPPKVAGDSTVPKKQLKEVIFDPAELQPKQLVPPAPQ